ncbi:MAG: VWA domain-containing protein [Solirubrobacterales bacterium]
MPDARRHAQPRRAPHHRRGARRALRHAAARTAAGGARRVQTATRRRPRGGPGRDAGDGQRARTPGPARVRRARRGRAGRGAPPDALAASRPTPATTPTHPAPPPPQSPDPRATLRRAHRTGGDPVRIVRRRRRVEQRRLVLLCDISSSMESYSRAYLQLLESAVGGAQAEAFTFATRLTRVTAPCAAATTPAPSTAPPRRPGGRAAPASARRCRLFNRRHGRRGLARGAVVVILSDGWERGDPALVAREMQRLRRSPTASSGSTRGRLPPASSRWPAAWPRSTLRCDGQRA